MKKTLQLIASLFCFAFAGSSLQAATHTFTSNANMTWETATWTPAAPVNGPDGPSTNAIINANAAGTRTATINNNHTIGQLQAGRGGADATRMWVFGGAGILTLDNTGGSGRPFVGQNTSFGYQEYPMVFAGTVGARFGLGGTMVIKGNNTFSGNAEIDRGTQKIGHLNALPSGSRLGDIVFTNASGAYGTLDLNGFGITINGLYSPSGQGTINQSTAASITLNVGDNNANGDFGGIIKNTAGTLSLTKTNSGTLILRGTANANTYSGSTTILAGTLRLGASDMIPDTSTVSVAGTFDLNTFSEIINGLNGAGTVDTVAGGTPTLAVGTNNGSGTFSGVIKNTAGTLAFTKSGTGTQVLSGPNAYTGNTTVSAGKLLVNGSLASGSAVTVGASGTLGGTGTINGSVTVNGTVAPGASIGTLTFTVAPTLSGTTTMEIDRGASPNADKIVVSTGGGTLNYGGTLTVVNNGVALQFGDTFDLFDADSFGGSFTGGVNLPSLGFGLQWDTSQLTANGTISVSCIPPTANAGADQTICSSGTATLAGSFGGGASSATWSTSGTGTFSPSATTTNATYTPSAADKTAGTVTLTLTSDAIGTCTPATDTMVITINPQAIADAGPDQAICADTNATLAGSISGGATTGTWSSSGTGTFSPTPTTLNATYAPSAADKTAGSVTLTLTADDPDGAGPCGTVADTMVLTINALPAIAAAPTNITVAATSPARFYVTATGAGLTYQWQVSGDGGSSFTNVSGNGTSASYTNPAAALSESGYKYQAIVSGTCNPSVTSSPPAVLTVIEAPKAVVSGDATICNGGSTTISAALTGNPPWDVYWSDGTTQTGVTTSPATRNVSPSVTKVYTVTNLTDFNFTAFPSDLTGSATVTVNYAPAITAQPTNLAVCSGLDAIFTVGATGTALTYQWQVSGDGGSTFTNIPVDGTYASYTNTSSSVAQDGYQYQVVISGACSPSTTSSPAAVLTVHALPTLSVDKTDVTCNGAANGTVVATYGGGTGPYTISLDGGAASAATGSPQTFTGQNIGTHTVVVFDSFGCSSGVQTTAAITQPTAVVAGAGPDVAIKSGGSVQIGGSPTGSGGTPGYTYSWTPTTALDDPTLANPTASPTTTTTYTVTVTDANGCTGSDSAVVNVPATGPLSWVAGNGSWDFTATADRWQDNSSLPAVYGDGYAVVFGSSATVANPTITLNTTVQPQTVTFNSSTKNYTISGSGAIAGTATLTKSGSGTVTLSTANTFNGQTTVSAGVLLLANANALGTATTNRTINSGGTLGLSGGIAYTKDLAMFGNGAGTAGAIRNYSGSNSVNFVQLDTAATQSGRVNSDAGTLVIGQMNAGNKYTLTVGGAGDTLITTGLFWGGEPGNVTKDGSGKLTLSGACQIRGTFTVTAGTFQLGAANRFGNGGNIYPDMSVTGTFDLNGFGERVDGLIGGGSVINAETSTLVIGSDSTSTFHDSAPSFTGVISGGTTIQKGATRTQTFGGHNTYSGNTVINAGTLKLSSSGSISNTPTITVASGATFDVSLVSGYALVSGQTLNGNGTVFGGVTVGSGATVAPGTSIGTLTFSSGLTNQGTLNMEINKTAATADKIVMSSGTLMLGGSLVVNNLAGTLARNDTFDLIDGTIAGSFASVILPSLPTGLVWDYSQLSAGGNGTIKVVEDGTLAANAGADRVVCLGNSTTIGGSPTASGGSVTGYTYSWSPTTGLNDATLANPTATPTTTTTYTVTVTDANSSTTNDSVVLTVSAVAISPGSLTDAQKSSNYNATISASGGIAPYTFSLTSGTLPNGLTLASGGVLSGVPTNIGFYSFTVTGSDSSNCSAAQAYTLKVLPALPDTNKPIVSITNPVDKATVSVTPASVTGKASDLPATTASGVYQILYGLNGGSVTNVASGTTNWSAAAAMVPGTNTFTVKSKDLAGNESLTATRKYFLSVRTNLTVVINGLGSNAATAFIGSGTPTNNASLELGRAYTVTGIPGSNYIFSNWLASVDGGPTTVASTNAKYTFMMQTNLTLTVNFVTNRFNALASGPFYGLFSDTNNGVAHQTAGFAKITAKSTRKFDIMLNLDGQILASTANGLDLDGHGVSKPIVRKGRSSLIAEVQFTFDGTDKVTGIVTNPTDGWYASILGYKSVFNNTNYQATNFMGSWTAVLPGTTNTTDHPRGDGYCAFSIKTNGTYLNVETRLGDNQMVIPVATVVTKDGWMPFYAATYPTNFTYTTITGDKNVKINSGSIMGWLQLSPNPGGTVSGDMTWIKPVWTNGFYNQGFTNGVGFAGEQYVNPGTNQLVNFGASYHSLILTNGNLTTPIANTFQLSTSLNKVTMATTNAKASLTFTAKSGKFLGLYYHPYIYSNISILKSKYNGVVFQSTATGRGVFPGTNETGSVLIQ